MKAKELQGQQFDVVSCLNVLDRCDKPRTILPSRILSCPPNSIENGRCVSFGATRRADKRDELFDIPPEPCRINHN